MVSDAPFEGLPSLAIGLSARSHRHQGPVAAQLVPKEEPRDDGKGPTAGIEDEEAPLRMMSNLQLAGLSQSTLDLLSLSVSLLAMALDLVTLHVN